MKQIYIKSMPSVYIDIPVKKEGIKKQTWYTLWAIQKSLLGMINNAENKYLTNKEDLYDYSQLLGLNVYVVNEMKEWNKWN
jgi:hypothetical protein